MNVKLMGAIVCLSAVIAVPSLAGQTAKPKMHHKTTVDGYLNHSSKNVNHWMKGTSKKINHTANQSSKNINNTLSKKKKKS